MRVLVDQGGNQCAIVTDAYSPCQMEIAGAAPDLESCAFAATRPVRVSEFKTFEQRGLERRPQGNYPD
jgi:hypothetical protein